MCNFISDLRKKKAILSQGKKSMEKGKSESQSFIQYPFYFRPIMYQILWIHCQRQTRVLEFYILMGEIDNKQVTVHSSKEKAMKSSNEIERT